MTKLKTAVLALVAVFVGLSVLGGFGAELQAEKISKSKARLGTFDSRAVAIAYARSKAFHAHLQRLTTEHEKAKSAGDKKRANELKTEGASLQQLLHKQSFSTWPVDDILKTIEKSIPEIAKQAEVDAIVSKWSIVYQRPEVEFVDVTDLLVQTFDPDEATRKILKELPSQKPVPLKQFQQQGGP